MYEKFIVYTDHASLHCSITINDPSGRLIRSRLRLAEIDFEVKYKEGKANTPADVLLRLNTLSETIPHDDSDDITGFLLDETNLEFELNISPDEVDFIDVEYNDADKLLATLESPKPSNAKGKSIVVEELLQAQLHDAFCAEIHRKLNEGEVQGFESDDNGLLVRTSDKGI